MQRYSPIYDDPEGNLPAMQEDSDNGEYYSVAEVDARILELTRALQSCRRVLSLQRDSVNHFNVAARDAIDEANTVLMVTGAGK
jgi:hypothetical protein